MDSGLQAERALLGARLMDPDGQQRVLGLVHPDDFYRPWHGQVLAAMDWLPELWSVLCLEPSRTPGTLAGQAEWHTRLLAPAAEQPAREIRRYAHATGRPGVPGRTGGRP